MAHKVMLHHILPSKWLTKTGSLVLLLGAIVSTSSLLNACAADAQKQAQAPSPSANNAGSMQMDHGSMSPSDSMMNHSMEMDLGPADADFDLRFIDAMIPHHQGAVVMAKDALQKSKRPELQTLATDIIKAQDKEIAEMKQWRKAWYPKAAVTPMAWHAQMNHMMAMSDSQRKGMMMSMDLGAADSQFDLRFLNAMIPHHDGAVVMAKDALSKSKRPEIKQLAQAIIKSQQAEIAQMKQWKQAWYKQ
ncbi:MAG: DUF305 domain-containing protein [Leptolyngbya sp. BL-A-14]